MSDQAARQRLLVFIVAYNAERTITDVLARVPHRLSDLYDVEVLVIDDASGDRTFEHGERFRRADTLPFTLHVLFNPVNQGYGGNQKVGFHFAIEQGFDFVALVHGDGQYAPECLAELVEPLAAGDADAVFGSRMLTPGGALGGGMPLYKFVGNKILTAMQNRLLRTHLSEFHSGYRIYSTDALRKIPFDLNTNDFHFDTEIIIQLVIAGQRIVELPIPTYYGDEICHVNGIRYGLAVTRATLKARVQELDLLYDRKFDCRPESGNERYVPKFGYESTHTLALERIAPGSRVLDLGCAGGYFGAKLRERGCYVAGVDVLPLAPGIELDEFHLHNLNDVGLPVDVGSFEYIVMLDVIEHLASPEAFLTGLRDAAGRSPWIKLIISRGNVAFVPTRLMLLAGQFNYGKRGILDMTHTRLFTFATMRRLLDGSGFQLEETLGVPAPFTMAVGDKPLGRALLRVNHSLIRIRKQFFAYQVFIVASPRPVLPYLLAEAHEKSQARAGTLS